MHLGLNNKVAFVAASSQGLGKSVALQLAQEGATVIICSRNKESLEKAKQEIEASGNKNVFAFTGDLSIASEREKVIQQTLKVCKNVDILITNTGGPPSGKFE